MLFDHEKLDVYRASIEFVTWSYRLSKRLKGLDRFARDQLVRASLSIPLNIAEGNGRLPSADRQRFFRIALGSALECAATLDVLAASGAIDSTDVEAGKNLLIRIVAMLTKMTTRPTAVREEDEEYRIDGEEEEAQKVGNEYEYENENEYDEDGSFPGDTPDEYHGPWRARIRHVVR